MMLTIALILLFLICLPLLLQLTAIVVAFVGAALVIAVPCALFIAFIVWLAWVIPT